MFEANSKLDAFEESEAGLAKAEERARREEALPLRGIEDLVRVRSDQLFVQDHPEKSLTQEVSRRDLKGVMTISETQGRIETCLNDFRRGLLLKEASHEAWNLYDSVNHGVDLLSKVLEESEGIREPEWERYVKENSGSQSAGDIRIMQRFRSITADLVNKGLVKDTRNYGGDKLASWIELVDTYKAFRGEDGVKNLKIYMASSKGLKKEDRQRHLEKFDKDIPLGDFAFFCEITAKVGTLVGERLYERSKGVDKSTESYNDLEIAATNCIGRGIKAGHLGICVEHFANLAKKRATELIESYGAAYLEADISRTITAEEMLQPYGGPFRHLSWGIRPKGVKPRPGRLEPWVKPLPEMTAAQQAAAQIEAGANYTLGQRQAAIEAARERKRAEAAVILAAKGKEEKMPDVQREMELTPQTGGMYTVKKSGRVYRIQSGAHGKRGEERAPSYEEKK